MFLFLIKYEILEKTRAVRGFLPSSPEKMHSCRSILFWGSGVGRKLYFVLYRRFNPLTPMSDQDRISPYYIYAISCRQVMRIKNI